MSRFFRQPSESDSDVSDSDSDVDVGAGSSRFFASTDPRAPKAAAATAPAQPKTRRYGDIEAQIAKVQAALDAEDWVGLAHEFHTLEGKVGKYSEIFKTDGFPKPFIKFIADLETNTQETLNMPGLKTKLEANNYKALMAFKTTIRRHNKSYPSEIDDYRKHPALYAAGAASGAHAAAAAHAAADDDTDATFVPDFVPGSLPAAPVAAGDDSDGDDWPAAGANAAADDDVDSIVTVLTGGKGHGPAFWLKRPGAETELKPTVRAAPEPKPHNLGPQQRQRAFQPDIGDAVVVGAEGSTAVITGDAAGERKEEWTPEVVMRKLQELAASRGKKGIDRPQQLAMLDRLVDVCAAFPHLLVHVELHIVGVVLDTAAAQTAMPVRQWTGAYDHIVKAVNLMSRYLGEEALLQQLLSSQSASSDEGPVLERIFISINGYLDRLHEELVRAWQLTDHHTHDYIVWLQHELYLVALLDKLRTLLMSFNHNKLAATVCLRIIQRLYYKKTMPVLPNTDRSVDASVEESDRAEAVQALLEYMPQICAFVHRYGDDRASAQAVLAMVYHKSLHDDFYAARDLLLMSHLQDSIQHYDFETQLLHNRAMVQLGLCAFRAGLIKAAQACLNEISGQGKVRDLLAQGVNINRHDRNLEQERLERRRLVPNHMQINLDLIDFVHLVSAMILEVPNMAADHFDLRRRVISRPFRKLSDMYQRQAFVGPPENTRDHIMAAARALRRGLCDEAYGLLVDLPAWKLIAGEERVKAMLKRELKEAALRTYLFAYSSYYDTFRQDKLSAMFGLADAEVHAIVSKMMLAGELHASWDQPTSCIVLHKVEPSRLQSLSLQCAEKLASFVDFTERIVDLKMSQTSGSFGYRKGDESGDKQAQQARGGDRGFRRQAGFTRPAGRAGNNNNNNNNNHSGNHNNGNNDASADAPAASARQPRSTFGPRRVNMHESRQHLTAAQ